MTFRRVEMTLGGSMIVNAVMVAVGGVSIGFYVRFLLALCKESRGGVFGYWVRLRHRTDEDELVEPQQSFRRVA